MTGRRQEDAVDALLRMLARVAPGAEAEVHILGGGAMRRWRAAPGSGAADGGGACAWRAITPGLAGAIARGRRLRVEAALLGRGAEFCVLQPLLGAAGEPVGFILLADRRRRRIGPRLAAALSDAAEIAAPLLGGIGLRSPPGDAARPGGAPGWSEADAPEAAEVGPDAAWRLLLVEIDPEAAASTALDAALARAVARRLETCLAAGDRIAPIAGGRLAILAAGGDAGAADLAARLHAAALRPLVLPGRAVVVQIRVEAVAGLPECAPSAMLAPAVSGPRRARGRAPGGALALGAGGRLERDLAAATTRGQMRLDYQSYVELASGAISGVEALLRWRHPTRGELAPAAFIPLAEATGLILPLGAWALRSALGAARRWPDRMGVAVNVSALQFHQPGFVAEVEAALAASGVAPQRLELEITETVLMRDNPETKAQLDALIARGVRIALDDFGTGYSALAYLARLPHHRIKLDRAFVQDLGNPATLDLVRAILALARKRKVSVTAEGVERPDQLALVRALGFSHAQGFFTGPPVADPAMLLGEPQSAS